MGQCLCVVLSVICVGVSTGTKKAGPEHWNLPKSVIVVQIRNTDLCFLRREKEQHERLMRQMEEEMENQVQKIESRVRKEVRGELQASSN